MPRILSWLGDLVAELKRRHVLHVAAVYAVAAWIVIQVAAITFPALYLPGWAVTLVVALALLGFPLAMIVAWAFELTPDGVRRTPPPEAVAASEPAPYGMTAVLLGGLLLASVGAGWAGWHFLRGPADGDREATAAALSPTRIAVLYFDDLSADQSLRHIAHGFTEALTHELSQVEVLDVVPRTAVKPFRGGEVGLDSVARALSVGSIVEGSVERIGDQLRATVQLADAGRGTHLMSRQVERSGADVLALRDEIVEEAARLLRQSLGREIRLQQSRSGTDDAQAWSLFYRAEQLREDGEDLRLDADTAVSHRLFLQADSLLARAEARDGDWIEPTVARGWTALAIARPTPSVADLDVEALGRGLEHAARALRNEPGNAEALHLRGTLRYFLAEATGSEDTLQLAENDLRDAVREDPTLARAWTELSFILYRQARYVEAQWAARRAREVDAFLSSDQSFVYLSAQLAFETGELEEARRLVRDGLRLFPEDHAFHSVHLNVLAASGDSREDVDEAWRAVEAIDATYADGVYWNGRLRVAAVLARVGLADSARSLIRRVEEREDEANAWTPYYAAYALLQLGDEEEAIRRLERLVALAPQRRENLAREWMWDDLRDHPRFRALVGDEGSDLSRSDPP